MPDEFSLIDAHYEVCVLLQSRREIPTFRLGRRTVYELNSPDMFVTVLEMADGRDTIGVTGGDYGDAEVVRVGDHVNSQ